MKLDQVGDVDIRNTITVGEAERLFIQIGPHPFDPPAGHRLVASVNQCDPPWLGTAAMNFHMVLGEVECDVGLIKKIIGEVVLDHVAAIATGWAGDRLRSSASASPRSLR